MATSDAIKNRPGGIKGFFTIYKPGQGKWVRWGTVAGLTLVVVLGAVWLAITQLAAADPMVQTSAAAVWVLVLGLLTFWTVNTPKLAEFMIMTESEMRKVTWPTRREVLASTKVVITLTVLLGVLLYLVDVGFLKFFEWIGVA